MASPRKTALERLHEKLATGDRGWFFAGIADQVAERRIAQGLSQRELAELVGTTQSAIAPRESSATWSWAVLSAKPSINPSNRSIVSTASGGVVGGNAKESSPSSTRIAELPSSRTTAPFAPPGMSLSMLLIVRTAACRA